MNRRTILALGQAGRVLVAVAVGGALLALLALQACSSAVTRKPASAAAVAAPAARTAAEHSKLTGPSPGTEASLVRWIRSAEAGHPNYSEMEPRLAAAARAQAAHIEFNFHLLGAFQSLAFVRAAPNGWDAYTGTFSHGRAEFYIAPLAPDGKVAARNWKILSLAAAVPSTGAPSISGTWQGTLQAPLRLLRIEVRISRESGAWKARMYSIDQSAEPIPVTQVLLTRSKVIFLVNRVGGIYQGQVGDDGSSMAGTWMQARSLPLELRRVSSATAWPVYSTPYKQRFVTVQPGVKLQVLDWGGSGRPVILLAGQGNTAHIFDKFAGKLRTWYHVYGITRRGFGASSAPATGYSAARLGRDVVAVIDALKIRRPVLIGHSLGGEELSYVGSHDPGKVAGLIYLDAGYRYAFVDPSKPFLALNPPPWAPRVDRAIERGMEKFTGVGAPVLAIYADPHSGLPSIVTTARDESMVGAQIAILKKDDPAARVVRIPHANHYVFISNQAQVVGDVHAFIGTLSGSATPE